MGFLLTVQVSKLHDLDLVGIGEHHPVVGVGLERVLEEPRFLEEAVHGIAVLHRNRLRIEVVHVLHDAKQLGSIRHGDRTQHETLAASRFDLLRHGDLAGESRRDGVGGRAQVAVIDVENGLAVPLVNGIGEERGPDRAGQTTAGAAAESAHDLVDQAQIVVDDGLALDGDDAALFHQGVFHHLVADLAQIRVIVGVGVDGRQITVVADDHGFQLAEILGVADVVADDPGDAVVAHLAVILGNAAVQGIAERIGEGGAVIGGLQPAGVLRGHNSRHVRVAGHFDVGCAQRGKLPDRLQFVGDLDAKHLVHRGLQLLAALVADPDVAGAADPAGRGELVHHHLGALDRRLESGGLENLTRELLTDVGLCGGRQQAPGQLVIEPHTAGQQPHLGQLGRLGLHLECGSQVRYYRGHQRSVRGVSAGFRYRRCRHHLKRLVLAHGTGLHPRGDLLVQIGTLRFNCDQQFFKHL